MCPILPSLHVYGPNTSRLKTIFNQKVYNNLTGGSVSEQRPDCACQNVFPADVLHTCTIPWGLYSPRNDPDPEVIPNPEMIPKSTPKWSSFFFLSTPKWSPRNYRMVIKHGTVDCFFVLCWNAAILSFLFILTKFQTKGNYCSCRVTVSFQSRSSLVPVDFGLFSLMQNRYENISVLNG